MCILSTPPSLPSFDPLSTALILTRQQRLAAHLPLFLQQLSRPVVLLHPRPLETRCHLFLLPLYVQRCVLSFLSLTMPRLHCDPLVGLLTVHASDCVLHLRALEKARGEGTDDGAERAWLVSEYRHVFMLLERMCDRLGVTPPSSIRQGMRLSGTDGAMDPLLAALRRHATFLSFREAGDTAPAVDAHMDDASSPEEPLPAPLAPPSAFEVLLRRMCELEGIVPEDGAAAEVRVADEPDAWHGSWPFAYPASPPAKALSKADLVDFGDDVFHQEEDAEAAALHNDAAREVDHGETSTMDVEEKATEVAEDAFPAPGARPPPERLPADALQQNASAVAAKDEGSDAVGAPEDGAAVVQSLLSAVLSLQLHLADLQAPLSGQLGDDQLRAHPSLAAIIPQVDALHALTTNAFAAAFVPSTTEGALQPSSLPTKLLYLLVRLLLTSSVHHSRACVVVSACLSHVVHGEAQRDVLLCVAHAVSTHPAAVFSSLLSLLFAPAQRLSALSSSHLDLIRHCVKHTTRSDLVLGLLAQLCHALTANASSASAGSFSPLPSSWSLEILHLLLDQVPPSSSSPAASDVLGMLKAVGSGGQLSALDSSMQSKWGKVLKVLISKWPEVCSARKTEVHAACGGMAHFSVKKPLEKLMAL